jgi:hypothetical protein
MLRPSPHMLDSNRRKIFEKSTVGTELFKNEVPGTRSRPHLHRLYFEEPGWMLLCQTENCKSRKEQSHEEDEGEKIITNVVDCTDRLALLGWRHVGR